MDPLAAPLPSPKPISAVAITAHPMHPTETPAKCLIGNDRHNGGHEPWKDPENHQDAVKNLWKTTNDRPRFDNVNHRPVFLPMSPDYFHLGSHCAPIARQVEPLQRPPGVYLGPFDGGTQLGEVRHTAETVIRLIRTDMTRETDPDQTTPTYAAVSSDARWKNRGLDTRRMCQRCTTNGKHRTRKTHHTTRQQEAHVMNKPTRLIPDRGKNLHAKPNTT